MTRECGRVTRLCEMRPGPNGTSRKRAQVTQCTVVSRRCRRHDTSCRRHSHCEIKHITFRRRETQIHSSHILSVSPQRLKVRRRTVMNCVPENKAKTFHVSRSCVKPTLFESYRSNYLNFKLDSPSLLTGLETASKFRRLQRQTTPLPYSLPFHYLVTESRVFDSFDTTYTMIFLTHVQSAIRYANAKEPHNMDNLYNECNAIY